MRIGERRKDIKSSRKNRVTRKREKIENGMKKQRKNKEKR